MLFFSIFPVVKKFMDKGGGRIKNFRRKFYYLTVTKNSVAEHFNVSLLSGLDKFYASKGFHDFPAILF